MLNRRYVRAGICGTYLLATGGLVALLISPNSNVSQKAQAPSGLSEKVENFVGIAKQTSPIEFSGVHTSYAAKTPEIKGFYEFKDYAIEEYLKFEKETDNPKYSAEYFGIVIFDGFIDGRKVVLSISDSQDNKNYADYVFRMIVSTQSTKHQESGFEESETYSDHGIKARLNGNRDSISIKTLDDTYIESASWHGDGFYDAHFWKILGEGEICGLSDVWSVRGKICTEGNGFYVPHRNMDEDNPRLTGVYEDLHFDIQGRGRNSFVLGNSDYRYYLSRIIEELKMQNP